MIARAASAALLALALAACADPASVGQEQPAPSTGSLAPDAVVLRLSYEGGMIPAGTMPELPYWSLYGDGRVVTRGPEPAIYPGQALPNVQVRTVRAETVREILAAARAAGVDGETRDYGDPPVADAAVTVFRLSDEQGAVTTKVYALNEAPTGFHNEAREKLLAFSRRLTAPAADGGWGDEGTDAAYEPASVAVYARPYRDVDPDLEPQDLRWTGDDPATGVDTGAGKCLLLTGDALAQALPQLRQANQRTRWRTEGAAWAFQLRPLLPDERTCADGLR